LGRFEQSMDLSFHRDESIIRQHLEQSNFVNTTIGSVDLSVDLTLLTQPIVNHDGNMAESMNNE
jgi:hypothetical protein